MMVATDDGVGSLAAARRAAIYQTLSRLFDDPATWSPEFPDAIRRTFEDAPPDLEEPAADLIRRMEVLGADREELRVSFARLFVGPFEIRATPYASMYLDPDGGVMGPATQTVVDLYAEAGVGMHPESRDAPDHVTRELEFMYFLCYQEAHTGDHVWSSRQAWFWQQHAALWIEQFGRAVHSSDSHPIHTAMGALLLAFFAREDARLGG